MIRIQPPIRPRLPALSPVNGSPPPTRGMRSSVVAGAVFSMILTWGCARDTADPAMVIEAIPCLEAAELEARLADDPALGGFIDGLEAAMMAGDGGLLRDVIHEESMFSRVLEGIPDAPALEGVRAGYLAGTGESWRKAGLLEHYRGGHYRFLRVREIEGRTGLLFRHSEDNGQFNYHLHEIVVDESGRYRIADTYLVGLSEGLSDALRRGLMHLVGTAAPETVDEVQREESRLFVENLDAIGQLSVAIAGRRFAEALDRFHALPGPVQLVRDVLLMRIEAAAQVSPLMLDEALTAWKERYGDEAQLPLKFIDYHMARGEYAAAHELAERVEAITGGDSYLRVRIGELRFAMESQLPAIGSIGRGGSRGRAGSAGPDARRDERGLE